ncbi:cytochrome P450 [Epithele typhae]|uniref:cytochrome P450 n=1 Tax=Epithele typhae TaxID=378194 RepID=UPI002007BD53|nr:cytochrome P450 [Epithele typhae]KAH9923755.1 cytochrome P450 [Epithele typhae]
MLDQPVSLLYLVTSAVLAHLVWRLTRNYILPSPFKELSGPPAGSLWAGHMLQLVNPSDGWRFFDDLNSTYGTASKLRGFFGETWLHVYDPKALHHIFVKDQDKFPKNSLQNQFATLLLGKGLLTTGGDVHRKQRKMLNPVFSGAHMRALTPIFHNITSKLVIAIKSRVEDGAKEMDVLEWMGRTALELVGQGALGHSFDPLTAESQDEFTSCVKLFTAVLPQVAHLRILLPIVTRLGPAWFRRRLLNFVPSAKIQRVVKIVDVVDQGCRTLIESKKAALMGGDEELATAVGEGKDVMSVLLKANMMAREEDKLPDDVLLGQMTTFIVAGVDTTSNSVSRVLWLLCEHTDVQAKLRAEVREAQETYGVDMPYDQVMNLPYLDAICRETLRLYAPVNHSMRAANEDVVLPLQDPVRGKSGNMISEIVVPKGATVICNLRACNTNPAIWGEDAKEWKPERWLDGLPKTVDDAHIPGIYSNLMTFISGSHSCIGFKFSQLEMKVVLTALISNFKFETSSIPTAWQFAGIAFPARADDPTRTPKMFMKVSIAD